MKHFGDITKLNGADLPIVDVITGGSPCQDLSVAGKRAGLAGERSGLFMEQIRIIKEMREHDRRTNQRANDDIRLVRPRYMVWENVPGAFSSNKGEDFRAVLEETARVADPDTVIPEPSGGRWTPSGCIMGDGWSIAWRVHDAQFWGVPQRRKRIALVADFGGATAPEILFERESVSGNPAEGGQTGERVTDAVTDSAGAAISFLERAGCDGGVKESLSNESGQAPCQHSTISQCLNAWNVQSKHIQPENGIAEALYSGECRGGGESYVAQGIDGDIARTLTRRQDGSVCPDRGPNLVYCLQGNGIDRADTAGCNGKGWKEDESYTLNTIDRPAVAYSFDSVASNSMKSSNPHSGCREVDVSKTLDCTGPDPSKNQGGVAIVCSQDAYDKYEQTEQGASLKASGGNYGGGYREHRDTVGALCARDFKGVGSQYVGEGKCIVQSISEESTSEP